MITKRVYVKDIKAGDKVTDIFLVTEKNIAYSQKGNSYVTLRLRDRTGEIAGRIWTNAIEMHRLFQKGDIVSIQSRAVSYRNEIQLSISEVRIVDDPLVDPVSFSPTTKSDVGAMFGSLMSIVQQIKTAPLRELLNLIFSDEEIINSFKKAPAAKGFHHSYIGGLLEHTLSVAQLLDRIADHYQGINTDLLLAGGILHDIGKIYELSFNRLIDYTDEGRLVGHIVLGLELVNSKIVLIQDFPKQLALELRHILLSHHGMLEYGSPKRPKTLEALMVNFMDDLDAKVRAFQDYMYDSDDESNWTPFHRLLERFIYKG